MARPLGPQSVMGPSGATGQLVEGTGCVMAQGYVGEGRIDGHFRLRVARHINLEARNPVWSSVAFSPR